MKTWLAGAHFERGKRRTSSRADCTASWSRPESCSVSARKKSASSVRPASGYFLRSSR